MLKDKTVLITGGAGSLGKALVRRILQGDLSMPKKIIIFSRDEAKHHNMKVQWKQLSVATDEVFYGNFQEMLDFRIGDIRDYDSVVRSIREADVILNAAALKQVPVCEYFPYEGVRTNILGAQNIVRAIRENAQNVELVVDISTDKACKPINTYGMTKAIQERIFLEGNHSCENTRFVCVRYGNVMASTGSVIPLFQSQIRGGGPVTITTEDMTRFMMSLDTAVDTIFEVMRSGKPGDTYIPQVPSAKMTDLAAVMIGDRDIKTDIIGIRPGEKVHEILISEEEIHRTTERNGYYVIESILPELRKGESERTKLAAELSSKDFVVERGELAELMKREGHLDF